MIRRSIAGVILGVSLLSASFAWSGLLALRTVFDPDRSREVAEELLDNDEVRAQLIDNVSDVIIAAIPEDVPVSDELVESVATQVLNDPAVEELILRAFTDTHAAFLGDGDAPEDIDLTPVAEATRASLVAASPALGAVLPATPPLVVPLPTERIPDASPLRRFVQRAVPLLAIVGIGGSVLALVATTDRPSVLRRAGIWAITTTAVYLVIGRGVPQLLRSFAPDGAEVLAALLTALLRAMLMPSIVLGAVGAGLIVVSVMWPSGARRERAVPPEPARRADPGPTPQSVPRRGAAVAPTPRPPQPVGAQTRVQPMPQLPPKRLTRPDQAPQPPVQVAFAPHWVEGHGWVLDPKDPRPMPASARWVDGVGHVVPGPPPGT
ncbi:MAG: hypothetical protein ACC660_01875 [Acidimicrobiales bacterium]